MIYIETKSTDVYFNLAAEEYVMRNFPEKLCEIKKTGKSVFMLWRTDKCVIIGRNQIAAAEIDLRAAHNLGVNIVRRSSGGGAVFSDAGNIMHSLITPFNEHDDPKKIEREQSVNSITEALRKMGIPAVSEGRNDITAGGRKITGMAQFAIKNRLCTHGSLLYDADLDLLAQILKPDSEKITSKALKSVRARVINLCEYINPKISVTEFLELFKSNLFIVFGNKEEVLNYDFTEKDIEQINIIRNEKYANPEWLGGSTPKFTFNNSIRFASGKIEIFLNVERGIIKSCRIYGDFLGILPVEELEEKLINQPHDLKMLTEALSKIELSLYLGGIKRDELLECMF